MSNMVTVRIGYGGMQMENDCPAEQAQEKLKQMLDNHNARPTSKDKDGNQRAIIDGPFGKTRVTTRIIPIN